MLRPTAVCLLAAVATAGPLAWPRAAHGQDDWSVKRNPFDPRIVGRYKGILEKNQGRLSVK